MKGGYLTVGRIAGIPLRIHLTAPLLPALVTGFRFDVPLMVGIVVLVLAHELGHAAVARANGATVLEVCLHGLGGHCRHTPTGPLGDAAVAFGGVVGQAWVSAVLFLVGFVLPKGPLAAAIPALHAMNLRFALFNLVPVPPLDGARAFRLFTELGWVRSPFGPATLHLRDTPAAARAAGEPTLEARDDDEPLDDDAVARLAALEVEVALRAARAEARETLAAESPATRDRPGSSRP